MTVETFRTYKIGKYFQEEITVEPIGSMKIGRALNNKSGVIYLPNIESQIIQEYEVVDDLKNEKIDIKLTDGSLEIDKTGNGEYEAIADLDSRYQLELPAGQKDDDMLFYNGSEGRWDAVEIEDGFAKVIVKNDKLGCVILNENVIL